MPTPTPMPAFAPVDSPLECVSLLVVCDAAASCVCVAEVPEPAPVVEVDADRVEADEVIDGLNETCSPFKTNTPSPCRQHSRLSSPEQ